MKVDGTDFVPITRDTTTTSTNFTWISPDYKKVVFASNTPLDGTFAGTYTSSANVWTANVDGTGLTPLTRNSTSSSVLSRRVSVSPDGSKIVFSSYIHPDNPDIADGPASPALNIFVMNADGTNKRAITRNTTAGYHSDLPRFTRDSKKILFNSLMDINGSWNTNLSSSYNIFLANVDGSGITSLTKNTGASMGSSIPVGPDVNSRIVFTSAMALPSTSSSWNQGGLPSDNIWMINLDGTGLQYLTANTAANLTSNVAGFTPDGSKVLFMSKMDLNGQVNGTTTTSSNIWTMNTDGTDKRALTRNTVASADSITAVAAANGKILFLSLTSLTANEWNLPVLSYNLWTANIDGTGMTALTKNSQASLSSWHYFGWADVPFDKCL